MRSGSRRLGALVLLLTACDSGGSRSSPPWTVAIRAPATGTFATPIGLEGESDAGPGARHQWSLVSAPGSGHLLEDATKPAARLVPGALGTFVVALVVEADGRTGAAETSIEVGCRPPQRLAGGRLPRSLTLTDAEPTGCPEWHAPETIVVPNLVDLTVRPGVEITFGRGAELHAEGGRLFLLGSAEAPVVLRGESAGAGAWGGVRLTGALDAQLVETRIADAGAIGASVRAEGASTIALFGLHLDRGAGWGVWLGDRAEVAGYRGLTFAEVEGSVSLPLRVLVDVRTSADRHPNRPLPYDVRGRRLSRPTTIEAAPAPYRLVGGDGADRVILEADLTVLAGAALEVGAGLGLVLDFATFELLGTAERPIVLRGPEGPRSWPGLHVSGGARALFERVSVQGAGLSSTSFVEGAPPASITVTGEGRVTELVLDEVEIRDGAETALWSATASTTVRCRGLSTSARVVPGCSE